MKQFIKITSTLQPKNKAHELVQEHLKKLDCTLHPGIHSAKMIVNVIFNAAISAYSGRAALPELRCREFDGKCSYWVDGLIHLDIYQVSMEYW